MLIFASDSRNNPTDRAVSRNIKDEENENKRNKFS